MGRHHPVAGAAAAHRRKKVGAWGGRAGAREGRVPTGGRRREGAGSLLRSEPLRGILRSWKAPGVVSYVSDPISREPIRRAASFWLASCVANALPRGAHGRRATRRRRPLRLRRVVQRGRAHRPVRALLPAALALGREAAQGDGVGGRPAETGRRDRVGELGLKQGLQRQRSRPVDARLEREHSRG